MRLGIAVGGIGVCVDGARMAGRRRAGGGRRDDAEIITGDWAGGWRLWCWGVGAKEERFGP